LVFIVLIFTGGIGRFVSSTSQISPSANQTTSAQCAQYAAAIQQQMGTSTDSSSQLQMLANSQYVSTGCSVHFQYSFILYNDSVVICRFCSSQCIILSGSDSCSSCQPSDCILGCQLK